MMFPVLRVLLVPLLAGILGSVAAPQFPTGYEVYHSISADFDGDGQKETAYAIAWKEFTVEHPPRLWVMKGERRLLDLWLKDTNALSTGNVVEHEALQEADLTGDGRPEILFIPSSAGGSGGTQYPRVATWSGREFANLRLEGRKLTHISENGGAVLKRGTGGRAALYLYEFVPGTRRYQVQRFTYKNGKLAGEPIRRSTKTGKSGLKELRVL
jgi:hypothetical protein